MNAYGTPNQNSNCSDPAQDLFERAAEACASGDLVLGMHLYIAAFEKSSAESETPSSLAFSGLKEAWRLACDLKERALAEYIFEKMEPYLDSDEIAECARRLQDLALDRLAEYGFSREELQDMADMISEDIAGSDASIVQVEHVSIPNMGMFGVPNQGAIVASVKARATSADVAGASSDSDEQLPAAPESSGDDEPEYQHTGASKPDKPHLGLGVASADFNPYDMYPERSEGKSYHSATNRGSGWNSSLGIDGSTEFDQRFDNAAPKQGTSKSGQQEDSASEQAEWPPQSTEPVIIQGQAVPDANEQGAKSADGGDAASDETVDAPQGQAMPAQAAPAASAAHRSAPSVPAPPARAGIGTSAPGGIEPKPRVLNYSSLVGYDEVISAMRDFGVGLQRDQGFPNFVNMLNEKHGLDRMPGIDTLLFRAEAIEDATRFVDATIGELGLPALRMTMEEGVQGMPVLCVMTQGNNRPRMNHQSNRFEGPAVLVIDNLDVWMMPEMPEAPEGMGAFIMANMTRGAREAVNLIRSAVEDPDVVVLATSSSQGEPDPFFYELLEPISIVEVGLPNDKERADIWDDIAQDHPSMRSLDGMDLMRYSAGLSRYDIYMAAREAIEDAYKLGLVRRTYLPVTSQNIFEKLAACQPLESEEYRALEDKVASDFAAGLDNLEDLFDGSRG